MKYRTVIQIIADAENKDEAIDIAGEFLRGNLETGVRMKCRTKPLKSHIAFQASVLLILISVLIGIASFGYFKGIPAPSFPKVENSSAIQPPLRTAQAAEFKNAWQEEEHKKVLEYIKK